MKNGETLMLGYQMQVNAWTDTFQFYGNRGQMKVFTLTKTTISLYFNLIVKTFI